MNIHYSHASVSEFRGYCGAYSHWKFQQTPIIKKSVLVTPEICNKAWREGIVTLPGITTRSVRLGDSILYDYVPQGIIRVDLHVTSCQGTQVRLGSQKVEESLVLSQYHFEIAEEEFIFKEDGKMEARISRVSLANMVVKKHRGAVYLRKLNFYGLNHNNIAISCGYIELKQR